MRTLKSLLIALATLSAVPLVTAQTPPKAFNYQALIRDGTGQPLRNRTVSLLARLHQDSATGTFVYQEGHSPTTNGFGNINLVIGGGSVLYGTFAGLDWSRPMFIQFFVDISGGTAYTDLGFTQLLSVPYALYSEKSATTSQGPGRPVIWSGGCGTQVGDTARTLCLDMVDFNTASAYLSVSGGDQIVFSQPGYYHLNFHTMTYTVINTEFLKNGVRFERAISDGSNTIAVNQALDVIWPFAPGDVFTVRRVAANGVPNLLYYSHPWNRLQISYVGPL